MKSINHILVVMNPNSEHQPALVQALKIAKKSLATIELFVVAYNSDLMSSITLSEAELKKKHDDYVNVKLAWLSSYSAQVAAEGIQVKEDAVWCANFSHAVLAKASQGDFSLVVKSTKEYSLLKRIFFTPNDWKLLKHCPVPLLLTKIHNESDYGRVMAAIDPDKNHNKLEASDVNVLSATLFIANLFEAQAEVCHCYQSADAELWQNMSSFGMENGVVSGYLSDYSEEVQDDRVKQHHKTLLETLVEEYQVGDKYTHLIEGSAEVEIPALVKENNVDLLVMGMSDNGQYIGNLVEKILDNVSSDILSLQSLESIVP